MPSQRNLQDAIGFGRTVIQQTFQNIDGGCGPPGFKTQSSNTPQLKSGLLGYLLVLMSVKLVMITTATTARKMIIMKNYSEL